MKIFTFKQKAFKETAKLPNLKINEDNFVLITSPDEIESLQPAFKFDPSTIEECTNIEDKVRYNFYKGYDFLSISYPDSKRDIVSFCEINLFVSKNYLILVLPKDKGENLAILQDLIIDTVTQAAAEEGSNAVSKVYYAMMDTLVTDILDIMEELEDEMHDCHDEIIVKAADCHFAKIGEFRKSTYTLKKQMRALSMLGCKILVNHNKLIADEYLPHFQQLESRLKNLLAFSESLNELSIQLLNFYESKLAAKTNDAVNKLTALTILFAPLTLITGIYGMNFTFMPELPLKYSYPIVLFAMAAISGIIIWILKRKKWL